VKLSFLVQSSVPGIFCCLGKRKRVPFLYFVIRKGSYQAVRHVAVSVTCERCPERESENSAIIYNKAEAGKSPQG